MGRPLRPLPGQKTLDYSRGRQLRFIRECRLNDLAVKEGRAKPRWVNVSHGVAKAVLKALDDHGGGRECWVSCETIAAETGFSLRQVKRAIDALLEVSLIVLVRKGVASADASRRSCNHYSIAWTELAVLCQREQSAIEAYQSATGSGIKVPLAALEAPLKRLKKRPPPDGPRKRRLSWRMVVEEFRQIIKIRKLAKAAFRDGDSPEEFRSRIVAAYETADLNAGLLTSRDGAVAYVLEYGVWPIVGIVSIDEHRLKLERDYAAAAAAERERVSRAESVARDRVDLERLNAIYGSALDAIPRQSFKARFGCNDATARYVMQHGPGILRVDFLRLMEERYPIKEPSTA